jgi:hypothetical protein
MRPPFSARRIRAADLDRRERRLPAWNTAPTRDAAVVRRHPEIIGGIPPTHSRIAVGPRGVGQTSAASRRLTGLSRGESTAWPAAFPSPEAQWAGPSVQVPGHWVRGEGNRVRGYDGGTVYWPQWFFYAFRVTVLAGMPFDRGQAGATRSGDLAGAVGNLHRTVRRYCGGSQPVCSARVGLAGATDRRCCLGARAALAPLVVRRSTRCHVSEPLV